MLWKYPREEKNCELKNEKDKIRVPVQEVYHQILIVPIREKRDNRIIKHLKIF